jgi:hypothetical protein
MKVIIGDLLWLPSTYRKVRVCTARATFSEYLQISKMFTYTLTTHQRSKHLQTSNQSDLIETKIGTLLV